MKKFILLIALIIVRCFGQSAGLTVVTVPSGATPTLTTNAGFVTFVWTLSTNVTSSTFSSAAVGAGSLVLCENGTGGYTVAFPSNFVNFQPLLRTVADYCQYYTWEYDGTNVNAIGWAASGIVDGGAPITITTGTSETLGGGIYHSGYTLNQEGTAGTGVTYTLPPTVQGEQYCVINSGTTGVVNTGVLTVYPPSGSYVILKGVVNTVGGGGTHGVVSGGAAGDSACFTAIDATHWQVWPGLGTWIEN